MLDRTRSLAVLATVALAGCQQVEPARVDAPADSAAGEFQFQWVGPNDAALVVPVVINGTGPHPFVLDTGATLTCVDESLATELELPEATGQIGVGAGIGGAGRMRLVQADSVRVGPASAEDLPLCALDLSAMSQIGVEIRGLLGLNFLRPFRLAIDFERRVVTLHRP